MERGVQAIGLCTTAWLRYQGVATTYK